MLQSCIKLKEALVNTRVHRHQIEIFQDVTLSEFEWQHVKNMIEFLKVPEQLSKELGASLEPTIVMATKSNGIMVRHAIKHSLSSNPTLQAAGKALHDKLKLKEVHLKSVPGRIASFLDLRVTRETNAEAILSIKELISSIMNEQL